MPHFAPFRFYAVWGSSVKLFTLQYTWRRSRFVYTAVPLPPTGTAAFQLNLGRGTSNQFEAIEFCMRDRYCGAFTTELTWLQTRLSTPLVVKLIVELGSCDILR